MEETHVVTCFLRNRAAVLLLRRSEAVGSYAGRWGGVSGYAEGDPDAAAREEISEETDLLAACSFVRRGDPVTVADEDLGTRWVVHPYLFDSASRDVTTNEETSECEWVSPAEIRRRETVPGLWTAYDRVRPTAETVAGDREHGAAYVSVRALEVLRDEAAVASERADGWESLTGVARALLSARPAMTVVANRVNRAMDAAADERTPRAVEAAASDAIAAALDADDAAAATAADRLDGGRVVTLSRSGTVERALELADPAGVLVAESRPGGEGVDTAERLAEAGHDVALVPDAALAYELARGDYDAVLVGADTVLRDGRVVNKVGTRAVALAGTREGVPVYAVAARDKISPDAEPRLEAAADVSDGDADLDVSVPLFDVTPADLLDGVLTEDGLLGAGDIEAVADEHRERTDWA